MKTTARLVWLGVATAYIGTLVAAGAWFVLYDHQYGYPPVLGLFEFDGFVWRLRDSGHHMHLPWRFGGRYTRMLSGGIALILLIALCLFGMQRGRTEDRHARVFLHIPEIFIFWAASLAVVTIIFEISGQWSALSTPNNSVIFWGHFIGRSNGTLLSIILASTFSVSWILALTIGYSVRPEEHRIATALIVTGFGGVLMLFLWLAGSTHVMQFENSVYTARLFSGLLVLFGVFPLIIEWNRWLQRVPDDCASLCPSCKYDLRGSIAAGAAECPECGHAIPRNAQAAPLQ